jgi:hypothetical protein
LDNIAMPMFPFKSVPIMYSINSRWSLLGCSTCCRQFSVLIQAFKQQWPL